MRSWALLLLGLSALASAGCPHSATTSACPRVLPPMLSEQAVDAMEAMDADGAIARRFYDPVVQDTTDGLTHFSVHWDGKFHYEYQWWTRPDGVLVEITNGFSLLDTWVSHMIRMPSGYSTTRKWYRRLLLHEYDHVAISLDGRAMMLFDALARSKAAWTVTLPVGTKITKGLVADEVRKRVRKYRAAVVKLIQHNYDVLDDLTDHGLKPLADRRAFFERCYALETLEEAGFPPEFIAVVRPVVQSPRYKQARRYYRLGPSSTHTEKAGPTSVGAGLVGRVGPEVRARYSDRAWFKAELRSPSGK